MMADEYEILYLEETGGWALMLPEGAVLHGHGPSGNDEEEEVFYECEAVETAGQESAIRCIECGLMISESRIEELIDTLDNEIEDEGEGGQG